jgi:hypothetical protein
MVEQLMLKEYQPKLQDGTHTQKVTDVEPEMPLLEEQ